MAPLKRALRCALYRIYEESGAPPPGLLARSGIRWKQMTVENLAVDFCLLEVRPAARGALPEADLLLLIGTHDPVAGPADRAAGGPACRPERRPLDPGVDECAHPASGGGSDFVGEQVHSPSRHSTALPSEAPVGPPRVPPTREVKALAPRLVECKDGCRVGYGEGARGTMGESLGGEKPCVVVGMGHVDDGCLAPKHARIDADVSRPGHGGILAGCLVGPPAPREGPKPAQVAGDEGLLLRGGPALELGLAQAGVGELRGGSIVVERQATRSRWSPMRCRRFVVEPTYRRPDSRRRM